MGFTMAAPGSVPPPAAARPKPALAPLARAWKDYTAPGCYEVTRAVTGDGWMFERMKDGTWATGWLPAKTVVKVGLRNLRACRVYAGSGRAAADLERIQAQGEHKSDGGNREHP